MQSSKEQFTGVVILTDNFFTTTENTRKMEWTHKCWDVTENHQITNGSIEEYYMNGVNQRNKFLSEKDKYYESQNWDDLFA